MNNTEVVISFDSTHDALAAQHDLSQQAIPFRVIPTPVEITSDCGIALLVDSTVASRCIRLRAAKLTRVTLDGNRLAISGPYIDC